VARAGQGRFQAGPFATLNDIVADFLSAGGGRAVVFGGVRASGKSENPRGREPPYHFGDRFQCTQQTPRPLLGNKGEPANAPCLWSPVAD